MASGSFRISQPLNRVGRRVEPCNHTIERRRTCDCLSHEKIDWQYEVCTRSYQKHRNEEEGRVVAFVTEVRPRDEMIFGIVGVMEIDMVAEELTAHWMVAELVVHQRLCK